MERDSDDLSLPKATVQKVISEVIPSFVSFSKESRDAVIECCIEFIGLLTTQANEIAESESKKTIGGEHVMKALKELGFAEYVDSMDEVIEEHKEIVKIRERKNTKFQESGLTEEELLRKQEELFGLARSKLNNVSQDPSQEQPPAPST
ncbi:hypothetical protein CANCADRAFT_2916 [Tortispora caseinolytica NRRL Y-17796]|uniref:Transcription factor CBF/NF-Y/archaeal histone domain-containing protein n=1 Tax=Tortispora caseinolytica NRRL Y-17796 TaxID=767744 RepID=A0A1E4THG2_9ASCO|nr:hypothetical protein CANCADRAFT_2916 [Tortispora caseinolytica NRRL Y-17796]